MVLSEMSMSETEVSLRLAFHLLKCRGSNGRVDVAIDGAQVFVHGKEVFPISEFIRFHGWDMAEQMGKNGWQGRYQQGSQTLCVTAQSGVGDVVAEIKQLRDFRTWHTCQTQAGNESLTKLPELKSLWLGQRLRCNDGGSNAASLDDSTFNVLSKIKTLESLTLDEARLSLAGLQRLKELPHLKKLELRRIDIPAADVEALRASLPAVAIDWKPLQGDERTKLEVFLKK